MLSNTGIDDLFEIIKGKEIRFQRDGIEENVEFIDKDPNLKFKLNKEKRRICNTTKPRHIQNEHNKRKNTQIYTKRKRILQTIKRIRKKQN